MPEASSTSHVEFFAPRAVIAALADWELQTGGNPTLTRQRAQALKSNGDQMHAVQYGAQIAYSETFAAKTVADRQQEVPGRPRRGAGVKRRARRLRPGRLLADGRADPRGGLPQARRPRRHARRARRLTCAQTECYNSAPLNRC